MDESWLEAYLAELAGELRARGMFNRRIIVEVQDHLREAAARGVKNGLSGEQAREQALGRFGPAQSLALQFYQERDWSMQKALFIVAVCMGLMIAYVDSGPTWDDTGITAMALLVSGGILGILGPKRPWLWALAVGIWIPLHAILTYSHNFTILFVLIFPFFGAYAGMAFRKILTLVRA